MNHEQSLSGGGSYTYDGGHGSDNGCAFGLHTEVDKDSVVAIRPIKQLKNAPCEVRRVLFRVARVKQTEEAWTLGAAKLDQDTLWSCDSLT